MKKGKRIVAALLSALLITGTGPAPVIFDTGFSLTAYAAESVKTPSASAKSGTYTVSTGKNITLSCGTKGADIYYSLNGSDYKKYTSKLSLTKNSELELYASYKGKKSKTVSYSYKLKPKITVSKKAGKYSSGITVKLSTAAKNVKFYYTLDGSTPTEKSTKYTSKGIRLTKSCKLRVAAVKSGWTTNYYTGDYTIGSSSVDSDGILNDYTQKYYYNQLNSTEKKLYATMFKAIAKNETDIYFKDNKVSEGTLGYVFQLLRFENPQFFWMVDSYHPYYENNSDLAYGVKLDYAYSKSESKKMQAVIDKKAAEFRKKLSSCKTEYEKVLKIHDLIVNTTEYVYTGLYEQHNLYGVLVDKKAVCQGYANAFSYFCQLEGIQCVNVNGKAAENDTEWHEWNRVKVDGKWYNMDVTWDDPVGTPQVLLHDYFLITDKQLDMDHVSMDWFPFGNAQKATSTDGNYFKNKGLPYYTDSESAYKGIIKRAASNYKKGVYTTFVYCHTRYISDVYDIFDKEYDKVFAEFGKYKVYPSEYSFYYDGNKVVLTLK